MKRICALICAMAIMLTMLAPACFAANPSGDETAKSDLIIEASSPEDGTEGVAVDNFSMKIYFNKDVKPADAKVRESNAKQFKLKSEEGKKVPVKVYYSDDEEGLILVAVDVANIKEKQPIKGNKKYTLTIKKDFQAADGSTLGQQKQITLKTLNQQRSTIIYMLLMGLMMVGMVFFTLRSQKKAAEKEAEEKDKKKKDGVNPYKEAKKTGKTVAEIVESENKKKTKKELAQQEYNERIAKLEAQIMEEIRRENNKRVKGPRPISAAGSTYKVQVKETKKPEKEQPRSKKTGSKQRQHKKK